LFLKLSQYHWKLDAQGELTDQPSKVEDDEPDSFRYLCQNVTVHKKGIQIYSGETLKDQPLYKEDPNKNWMKKLVADILNNPD
jgi:hypothetical protein